MPKDPMSGSPERLLAAFDFAAAMAEKDESHESQMRALLLSLLDVLDSFDRYLEPLEAQPDASPGQTGDGINACRLIRKQLQAAIRRAGVEPIECLNRIADPERHEIVEVRREETAEEDMIVAEVRRGYIWNGQTLRQPQVAIAGPAGGLKAPAKPFVEE